MSKTVSRRSLLRGFAVTASAACLCPVCSTILAKPAQAGDGVHWTYEGHGGPGEWGGLAPEYAACGGGREQSPIDLSKAIAAVTGEPQVAWSPIALEVVHNGHTIQVNCAGGGTVTLDGQTYDLLQFHFHHPSEHTIDGRPCDMEIHFVHKSASGLAVLGVMVQEGAANPTLETIWSVMPTNGGQTVKSAKQITMTDLLPGNASTYRYAGSLTTPPCSEVVSWVVYRNSISASKEQIAQFAKLFPNNARPVQPLNRRKLLQDIL